MSSSWFSLSPINSDDDEISPPHSPTATVKSDFSLITQTIGRQLHNVASFLAPPPQSSSSNPSLHSDDSADCSPSSTSPYGGIKNDLAEIGVGFKTGISLLSSNKAVNEISKFASNLLQFDKGDDDLQVGITDDVIDFVREISLRPQCWIDFPLSLQHKDFNISQVQKDHCSAIEQLVPSLATLRRTIHNYMSEEQFWLIYFVLLLPRLNEDDYMLLSTPDIAQVREVLLQKLRNKKNAPMEVSDENPSEPENRSSSEKGSTVNSTKQTAIESPCENSTLCREHDEEDVSFSDLEDDDNDNNDRLSGIRQTQSSNLSSASETGDWVHLNETSGGEPKARHRERRSESEESSDWLAVVDVDL